MTSKERSAAWEAELRAREASTALWPALDGGDPEAIEAAFRTAGEAHRAALAALARLQDIEGYADEEAWRQTSCALCGLDVEGDPRDPEGEWTDRGGNATCAPYMTKDEVVTPPEGQKHKPAL